MTNEQALKVAMTALEKIAMPDACWPERDEGYGAMAVVTAREAFRALQGAQEAAVQPEPVAVNIRLRACVSFFKSVIQSGESWTPTCDAMYEQAVADTPLAAQPLTPPAGWVLVPLIGTTVWSEPTFAFEVREAEITERGARARGDQTLWFNCVMLSALPKPQE